MTARYFRFLVCIGDTIFIPENYSPRNFRSQTRCQGQKTILSEMNLGHLVKCGEITFTHSFALLCLYTYFQENKQQIKTNTKVWLKKSEGKFCWQSRLSWSQTLDRIISLTRLKLLNCNYRVF